MLKWFLFSLEYSSDILYLGQVHPFFHPPTPPASPSPPLLLPFVFSILFFHRLQEQEVKERGVGFAFFLLCMPFELDMFIGWYPFQKVCVYFTFKVSSLTSVIIMFLFCRILFLQDFFCHNLLQKISKNTQGMVTIIFVVSRKNPEGETN